MYIECIKSFISENEALFTKGYVYPIKFDKDNQIIATNDKEQEHVVSWFVNGKEDEYFTEHFKLVTI